MSNFEARSAGLRMAWAELLQIDLLNKEKADKFLRKNKKIVKYRKPFSLNIGVVIFAIIFIYLVFNVFTYMTTSHISVYEVEQGTMAANNVYRGLVLRDETIVSAPFTGSLNYYMKEVSRVGYGGLVCSIDESGDISKIINEANQDSSHLDQESLEAIEESILEFQNSYDTKQFHAIYAFKEDIDSALKEALSIGALSELSDYTAGAQDHAAFHPIYSDVPGILVYSTDGYENVTVENFSGGMFDETAYVRTNLSKNSTVTAGEPLYKLINSEQWNIVIPISKETAAALADDDTMKIRFVKDEKEAYATYTVEQRGGTEYLILTLRNSMVRYAKDRFLEIDLLLSEETGLKIPNSSITEKEFYTIPIAYFVKGGDSSSEGLLVERLDSGGAKATEFVTPSIYYETDDYYYIDSEKVSAGERLVKSDSNDTYIVGTDTANLKGVYNINKGYAVFKQIDILYQGKEYTIVKTGTTYGISLYDHIALDSTKVNENELIK